MAAKSKRGRPHGIHTKWKSKDGEISVDIPVQPVSPQFKIYEEPPTPVSSTGSSPAPTSPGGLVGGSEIFLMVATMLNTTILLNKAVKINTDPLVHAQLGQNMSACMGGAQISPIYALVINVVIVFVLPLILAYWREIVDYVSGAFGKKGKDELKEVITHG